MVRESKIVEIMEDKGIELARNESVNEFGEDDYFGKSFVVIS